MEQQIYWNGSIITMEDATPVAQALLVQDGTILAVGTKEEILAKAAVSTRKIDLQGAALLPSFIDAHSHFMGYAIGLLQPSLEQTTDFQQLIHTIQDFIRENHIPKGHWVLAKGYDHNQLAEKCHPTRELLDQAAPEHPLIIQHQSGHMGVLNSLALELLGISPDTPVPSGWKNPGGRRKANRYLEENAFVEYLKKLPMDAMGDLAAALQTAQERYLQYGITTMQEGMSMDAMLPLFQQLTSQNRLKLDLIAYVDPNDSRKLLETFPMGKYHNRLRIGGYKIFLDGSPQSRTAWLREPYEDAEDSYMGYPALKEEQVEQAVDRALEENCQLLAHCNGDAACLQFLSAYQKARRGKKGRDIRPVMIHAQMLPPELSLSSKP